jgi:predicted ATPase/DNA-binding winged helix-turn-helix (wHTH) protein
MSVQQVGSPSVVRLGFGPFELNVAERSLKKANRNIPLGGRAYDILIALLENAGETVSKAELIAKVWPDVTVEEGGLRVHLSALRKALGDGQFGDKYIANIQGHGYRFIAPVTRLPAERDRDSASAGLSNLPPALGRMVGRDDVVPEIRSWLRTGQRLITVLGAGGMGKTTVALAVARQASADFSGAAFFVDLSAVSDKEQVIGAVASAIGLDLRFADPEKALLDFLRPRRALIILDSCEHLIKKTAEIADTVLQNASGIHMLATSREALQVAGERVLRLRPLDCPPEQPGLTASQVLAYPAAQLFVERVSARGGDCSLSDDEAPIVAEICRKLDGIALAIELAAGRAAIFGVRNTVARLGSRLDLLKFGRRTANPRHQTLKATLDWSHDHLSEVERVVLRRVAIFVGHFTLEAAFAAVWEEGIGECEIADAVRSLVDKSLVIASNKFRKTFYRLLDTTRSYALEKLAVSGEHHSIAMRHANFSIQLLENNRINIFDLQPAEAPAESLRDHLGNIRAALEWSFGPDGNDRTALRLAAGASQLFLAMLLLLECRTWMERAIGRMTPDCDPRHQMEVYAALALSFMYTEGNGERVREAFHTALNLAQRQEDAHLCLSLLSAMSLYLHGIVDAKGTYELALQSVAAAGKTGRPDDAAIAESLLGAAYCLRGEQRQAQEHLKRSLRGSPRRFNASQYLFDFRSASLGVLSNSLFFAGSVDQAVDCVKMNIEEAARSGHPVGLCRALTVSMRIYFWVGDLEQVERNLSRLEHTAETHSLAPACAVALGLRGRYLVQVGRMADGIERMQESLEKLAHHRYEVVTADLVSELTLSLARQDRRSEALALVDRSIAAVIKANRLLRLPAFFLAKGLAFASGELPETLLAEEFLAKAMTHARQEAALPFELRAGLELARIWIGRGEAQRAHDLISPVYNRFSEGFTTPDLIFARRILAQESALARQAG